MGGVHSLLPSLVDTALNDFTGAIGSVFDMQVSYR